MNLLELKIDSVLFCFNNCSLVFYVIINFLIEIIGCYFDYNGYYYGWFWFYVGVWGFGVGVIFVLFIDSIFVRIWRFFFLVLFGWNRNFK